MWNTIIGHEKQKDQLRRAITSSSVPHAYLFSGTSGIGKRLTARVAAATLLCAAPGQDAVPCGECLSCRKFSGRTHPDLTEIGPENNQLTIDLIREIKDQLRFAPLEGARRVIIIDQAELMNANAANASLKILEEPPPGNHFFLITSTPTQLLPTIISRCQKMEFAPLTNTQIGEHLTSHHGYTAEQARTAVEISEGSIERALSITPELIASVTHDLYQTLKNASAEGVLELSTKWAAEKDEIEKILYILHRCFHRALLSKTTPKGPRGEMENLSVLIYSTNDENRLLDKCNLINRSHSYLTRTYNKQLMFEQLLFTLNG